MKSNLLPSLTLAALAALLTWPTAMGAEAVPQLPVGEVTAEVRATAGDLLEMTREKRATRTSLTLTGEVTPELFEIIRDQMIRLRTLNLKDAQLSEIPATACAGMTQLANVTLPDGLTTIGDGAFMSCPNIKKITLPASVTTVGNLAFARTGLTEFAISANMTLGTDALTGCDKLRTITVDPANPNYTLIDGALFSADKKRLIKRPAKLSGALTLPAELKTIEPYACSGCTTMPMPTLPNGLETIGDYAFSSCSGMTGTLAIPATVKSIGRGAFFDCSGITGKLAMPAAAKGPHTFSYMTGLKTIELPADLTELPASAFEQCTGISTINSPAAVPPAVGTFALRGVDRNMTYVAVPDASVSAYKSAPVWSEFSNYDEPMVAYEVFSTNGNYRLKYVGDGPAKDKYLTFNTPDNTMARLDADLATSTVWTLDFFEVTYAALSYKGLMGSDIYYIDGARTKHINMAGRCWNDATSGYSNNANRTFAFFMSSDSYKPQEGPLVAIVGNGTLWGASEDGNNVATTSFTAKYPPKSAFVWRIEPEDAAGIDGISADSAQGDLRIYDLRGVRVTGRPTPGIYIVVGADGKAGKVRF